MMIGSTFHSYSLTQAIQSSQKPVEPQEKKPTAESSRSEQGAKRQESRSTLDSLGQGNLI